MHDERSRRPLRVLDLDGAGRRLDGAAVADLSAALGVERRRLDDQLDLVADPRFGHRGAGRHQREHARFERERAVALEARLEVARELGVHRSDGGLPAALPRRARAFALLVHRGVEAGAVVGRAACRRGCPR
jgi:hypothetical protein